MLSRTQRMIVAAALAALAVLPIAVFLLLRDNGDQKPAAVTHGCSAEEKAAEARLAAAPSPTPMGPNLDRDDMNREGRAAVSQPYIGMLCGFEIVATEDEARLGEMCNGAFERRDEAHTVPPPSPVPSELNKPGMTEQIVCKSGQVVAVYSPTGRRSYFSGAPKLNFVANREYLRVIQVDGHDVLLRTSLGPVGGPSFFAAVKRWPGQERPGILIAGIAGGGPDEMVQQVRQVLKE